MIRAIGDVLRPTANVWLARTWDACVVVHQLRSHDEPDVEITRTVWVSGRREEHTGVVPAWSFTVCGVLTHDPKWEPGWSDDGHRFAVGHMRGHYLPLRLLNPAFARPCQRCFPESS